MKKFLLGIGFLIVILLLILFLTQKIDLQQVKESIQKSSSKILEPIKNPVVIKEIVEKKIKEIGQILKEKEEKLFKKQETKH